VPSPGVEEFTMSLTTIFRLILGLFVIPVLACSLALAPRQVQAADPGNPAESEKFRREELAQMLGPIALYPDKLLSQILMASTYPIEVIEADRWVKKNPELQGDPLDRALLDKEWDPSVKAICHFPAILSLMSERITETTRLGNAFLAQEAEVMDMIQELRDKAYAQGNLNTTPEQKVIVEGETIVIEPVNPRVIYVPYYDPFYVYGPWWYPAYPPYYWGPPGVRVSLGFGIAYWPGIYFGFSFGDWCYFNWPSRYIYIHHHVRPRYVRHDHWYAKPGRWSHAPVHRRGVAYPDKFTATRYGQYPQRSGDFHGEVRGYPERREPVRERSQLYDERIRLDQERRPDDKSRYERSRQEQQRIERDIQQRQRQMLEPADRDRQQRQTRPEADRDRQQRQVRPEPDRDRQQRQRTDRQRQEQPQVERAPQQRERFEAAPQQRMQSDRERRSREALEREQPQRSRETVFEPRGNGRSERQSSERGRASRQERSHDSRDRGGGSDGKAGGREDGGRSRR
jgi:hypothetical protein